MVGDPERDERLSLSGTGRRGTVYDEVEQDEGWYMMVGQ